MIRAAVASAAIACFGASALAQQSFEIDPFDITGDLPPQFEAADRPSVTDTISFFNSDVTSSLIVTGSRETREDWPSNFEFSRDATLAFGATIEEETRDLNSFSFAGVEADGARYYRYTRFGKTCDLDTVVATLIYRHPSEKAALYEPAIAPLVASLFIGACG